MTKKSGETSQFEIKESEVSGHVRVNQEQTSADKTRRTALLGAIGVAGAAGLPSEWKKPIIDGLLLPAHAQMSPTTSTSTVTSNTSNTATGTGTSTMTSTSSVPTMTSTTSGTTIQTSTVTTEVTRSGTTLITTGTAACSENKYFTRITGQPKYNQGTSPGLGGEYWGATVSVSYSSQILCVDDQSNTTQYSTGSYGRNYYRTFPPFQPSSTIPGSTSGITNYTAPSLTNVSYSVTTSYTVSGTATASGTVTISG